METYLLLKTVIALLAVAAVGGLAMAAIRFGGKPHPPAWLAMLHGFLAAAGITLLLYGAFTVGIPALAQLALVLLLVAVGGGVVMNLGFHWKMKPLPKPLLVAYAILARRPWRC